MKKKLLSVTSIGLCSCLLLVACTSKEDEANYTKDYMEYNSSVLAKNADDFRDKIEKNVYYIDIKLDSSNPSRELNKKLADLKKRYKDNKFVVETIMSHGDEMEYVTAIVKSIPPILGLTD